MDDKKLKTIARIVSQTFTVMTGEGENAFQAGLSAEQELALSALFRFLGIHLPLTGRE